MAPTECDKTPENPSTPAAAVTQGGTSPTTRQSSRAADGRINSAAAAAAAATLFLSPADTAQEQESQVGQKRQHQRAATGTQLRQAHQQAKRPRTQQQQQSQQQQEEQQQEEQQQEEQEEQREQEEEKDDDTAVESGDREDDYEEENDEDFLKFIDECYGKFCTPEQLKELKRKLDPGDLKYWRDNFSTSSQSRYNLRWLIKLTEFFTISQGETDKFVNTTSNGVMFDWRTCHDLVVSDVEVLNQLRGIYVAINPGGDPNLTHDTAAARQVFITAFPNHGKSEAELESFLKEMFTASLGGANHTNINDGNARFIIKVGCILDQPLYKRLKTLLQFTTQHDKVMFKFFATKDLCGERVKLLEKLIKFSLFADSLYSGCGEVYYGNTQSINVLLRQAAIFAKLGRFSYKDRAGYVITSSNYQDHPKYQAYRCATNRNAKAK